MRFDAVGLDAVTLGGRDSSREGVLKIDFQYLVQVVLKVTGLSISVPFAM